jgi:hypothetical protein
VPAEGDNGRLVESTGLMRFGAGDEKDCDAGSAVSEGPTGATSVAGVSERELEPPLMQSRGDRGSEREPRVATGEG